MGVRASPQLQRYRKLPPDPSVRLLELPEEMPNSVHKAMTRLEPTPDEQHRQMFQELRPASIGVNLHQTNYICSPTTGDRFSVMGID